MTKALQYRIAYETDQHVAVSFCSMSRAGDADESRWSDDGQTTGVNNGIYDTRDARGWKDKKRERRGGREKFRHAGSVVLTGAVAGGRLARTLRRDVRRRSISDYLPLSSPSRFPPASHPPRPGTNGLPDDKPPFQPVTPTCDRH